MEKVTVQILTELLRDYRIMTMRIQTVFPCLWKNTDLHMAKEFFEAAVHDEQTIIKDTRKEVDFHIFSQSDTTLTPGDTEDSDCVKDSSDSEPEIVIYRNKKKKKKKR